MSQVLRALPLTAERFAPFGDVLEASAGKKEAMNSARFDRYNDLAQVNIDAKSGGRPSISIVHCRVASELPYRIDMLERHPAGSQAFMPLSGFSFVVVVAPPDEEVDMQAIAAFVTNGRQGINYHRGVWHMPMMAMQAGQEFLVIDRAGEDQNCDEMYLSDAILVEG